MRLVTLNRRLFLQKITALVVGTAILVPLLHFKLQIPALVYTSTLLIIHIFFLYLYFSRTPWRLLIQHRAEFILRLVAVAFFVYLLTLVKLQGNLSAILLNTGIALAIHIGILLGTMVLRAEVSASSQAVTEPANAEKNSVA